MAITSASAPSAAAASPMGVRVAVAAALAITGLVHLSLASTYGAGSPVVGGAFVLGGVVALIAAAWVAIADSDMAWDLAAAVSAGMLVALAVSATVGLFGIKTPTLGMAHIVSIVTELFVVGAWAAVRLRRA